MSTNDRTPAQDRVYMEQYKTFRALIDASKAEELRLRPVDPEPNFDDIISLYGTNEPTAEEMAAGMTTVDGETFFNLSAAPGYMQRMDLRRKASKQRRDEWEAAGSEEWKAARGRTAELYAQFYKAEEDLEEQFRRENFAALNGDREKILDDARQIAAEEAFMMFFENRGVPAADLGDETAAAFTIKAALRLHYEFFENDPDGVSTLDGIAVNAIRSAIAPASPTPKKYRTRKDAAAAGAISAAPDTVSTVTAKGYEASLSLREDGRAHLLPLKQSDGLRFSQGKLYIEGIERISEVTLQDMKTKDGIQDLDLLFLRAVFQFILWKVRDSNYTSLPEVVEIYIPTFAEYIGSHANLNRSEVDRLVTKIQSYHNISGVLYDEGRGKGPSIYQLLNFEYYDSHKNVIAFSSPYMTHVIKEIFKSSLRLTKNGETKRLVSGAPDLKPAYADYCLPSIMKEKNKAAAENVFIIVTTIAQAGPAVHNPHISARTIVERNPQFAARLEQSANPTVLLKTTFKKTWELLRKCTRLQDVYLDIQLPDPDNPKNIPTIKTLDTVFTFNHNGKRAKK